MKILQVIHGYPMRYNAGSEVYTQTLCHGLADRHEVHVFTREEDPFAPDFRLRVESDPEDARITLHVVNNPRNRDRYREPGIDRCFAGLLDRLRPDLVHVGHLNHLSTSLPFEVATRGIPVVHTLHDFWIMCPRGQFMQTHPSDPEDLWAACDGQDDRKCAEHCYARYFGGAPAEREEDAVYWTRWVRRRMRHLRQMTELVDLFVAPARTLLDRYRDEFGVPARKLVHLDYGFDLARLRGRVRTPGEPFVFGYIGTHIPAKGIHDLIRAFGEVAGGSLLLIWGRPRGQSTEALQALARSLPDGKAQRVEWLPEYRNADIVREVFDRVDAIVVPSVWVENSPLVIHEAQQARVPVITADAGGMAEYVRHEVNGLLFRHRSWRALALQMQRFADDPALARRLGRRGYLYSGSGDIPAIDNHVREIEAFYALVLGRRDSARVRADPGPWRITFDTNPDTCNCFANVKLNQRLLELPEVDGIFIHPNMSDGGLAAGASLLLHHGRREKRGLRYVHRPWDYMYLGPAFAEREAAAALAGAGLEYRQPANIARDVARALVAGQVVALFQRRMEYGPRALGNRSLLAAAVDPTMPERLNGRLGRTEFMPFAPVVLEEHAHCWFPGWRPTCVASRFMTITYDVEPGLGQRVPAVVHVDGTARPQVVGRNDNRLLHAILEFYRAFTGIPMLINTSFNIHEEPIVCSPSDAVHAFTRGAVDVLVMNEYWVEAPSPARRHPDRGGAPPS